MRDDSRDRLPLAGTPSAADKPSDSQETPKSTNLSGGFGATLVWTKDVDLQAETPTSAAGFPGAGEGCVPNPSLVPGESYVRGEEIGRGGLGRILKAHDRRLGRTVAVKELIQERPESAARLLREAFITARLQHPAIVPVYEAGYWINGAPFYAMKMVSGRSLQEVIAEAKTLAHRLALLPNLISVAEAVAYAHSEEIIHRDLKPLNILVGSFGETVVIDWGLAKRLADLEDHTQGPAAPGASDLTVVGSVLGTPAYMAPEQAKGLPAGKGGDVYALGAILYHLLTGSAPYPGETGEQILQKVRAGTPPKSLEEQQPQVPRDLAAIVHKAMAVDPSARYPNASELAADLKRFQTGQLVGAHHYSTWSLLQRWIRIRRAAVTVAAILLAALAGITTVSFERIVRERNRAEARSHELILMQARGSLEHDPTTALAWLKTYPTNIAEWGAVRAIAAEAHEQGVAYRVLRGHRSNVDSAVFLPDGRHLISGGRDQAIILWDLDSGAEHVLGSHEDIILQVASSSNGKMVASASADKTVRVWDLETGQSRVFAGHGDGHVTRVLFSPDNKSIASAGWDQTVRIWNVESGTHRIFKGHTHQIWDLAFSPDGKLLASASQDMTIRLWNVATAEHRVLSQRQAPVKAVTFSQDGRYLLSCSDDTTLQLLNLESNQAYTLRGHTSHVNHGRFSPQGKILASASDDKTIRLWDLEGRLIRVLSTGQDAVVYLAFAPNGRVLASGSRNGTVRLWDLETYEPQVLRGHQGTISTLDFSPNGELLALSSWDDTLRVWAVPNRLAPMILASAPMRVLAYSPRRNLLAAGGDDGIARLWNTDSDERRESTQYLGKIRSVTFTSDGQAVAIGSEEGRVLLWDIATDQSRMLEGHSGQVNNLAVTSDRKLVASASSDKTVRLWDTSSGTARVLSGHQDAVYRVTISPDAKWVASGGKDKTVRVWSIATGEPQILSGNSQVVRSLAFSKDGLLLAAASDAVRTWDLATGRSRTFSGHGAGVVDLRFVGDRRLASGGMDKRVIVWDLESGENTVHEGHQDRLTSIALSPDETRLASASWDNSVRLWDLKSGESRALRGHRGRVNSVVFAPDGKSLASVGDDGSIRFWRDDLPFEPKELHAWMESVTRAEVRSLTDRKGAPHAE